MSFGEQITKRRKELGISQKEMAEAVGVAKSTYCGYESDNREPDFYKIKKIAQILKTTPSLLIEYNNDDLNNKNNASPEISPEEALKIINEYFIEKAPEREEYKHLVETVKSAIKSIKSDGYD